MDGMTDMKHTAASKARDEFATAVMVRNIVARFIAKQAMEHNSPEALQKYLKEHPNADKSKHTVKKPEKEEKGKADEGKKDKGGDDDKMVRPSSPKKSEELGGELSQWQGPGTPAINHVNSYLIGNHPVSKGKVREAIKELEQYKVDAKAKGWKGHEKDIDDTDVMIGKLRKLVGDPEPKKLPKAIIDMMTEGASNFDKGISEISHAQLSVGDIKSEVIPNIKKILDGDGPMPYNQSRQHVEKLLKALQDHVSDEGGGESKGKSDSGKKPAKKRVKAVKDVMQKHDLKDDDADELESFKKRKPDTGKKLTDQQLMQKFLREASPETKERMKGMSVADFKAMYAAIMDEEGGE